MPALHTVNKNLASNSALRDCLANVVANSTVLLIEDGVYNAVAGSLAARLLQQHSKKIAIKALQADVLARGLGDLLIEEAKIVADSDFVYLVAHFEKTISWF